VLGEALQQLIKAPSAVPELKGAMTGLVRQIP